MLSFYHRRLVALSLYLSYRLLYIYIFMSKIHQGCQELESVVVSFEILSRPTTDSLSFLVIYNLFAHFFHLNFIVIIILVV